MPKVNVYLPDELATAVREFNVPLSAVCQRALEQAVRRLAAVRDTLREDADLDGVASRLSHFTDEARAALQLAKERSRNELCERLDTNHLLGGVLADGGSLALRVLESLEIDTQAVRRELDGTPAATGGAVAKRSGRDDCGPTQQRTGGAPALTGAAAAALELAAGEALSFGHDQIGCEHLLLGLVVEPEGAAGRLLRAVGAEPRTTRRAVVAVLGGYLHGRNAPTGASSAGRTTHQTAGPTAALDQALQPLMARIVQLESRVATLSGPVGSP